MPTDSPDRSLCPDDDEILALVRGDDMEGERYAELVDHLSTCLECPQRMEALIGTADEIPSTDTLALTDHDTKIIVDRIKSRGEKPLPTRRQSFDFLDPAGENEDGLGRIDKYLVRSIAGEGGMGVVFRAEDTELHRTVAIKVLAPLLAADDSARERFLREARSAAGTEHENVLPIHDMGRIEDHGLPYLVLPFVEGETLEQRIDRGGPLPIEEVMDLGKRIAAGLGAAHAGGLVHRDMKPANVLLENDSGRLFIADFGLARAVEDQAGLTGTGLLMGTPQFMSPEQATGETVDHRSDWFSFGAILYAMVTGKRPFVADSVLSTMRKVTDEKPPPLQKLRPDCPAWLKNLIDQLLEKDPDKRLTDAAKIEESFHEEQSPEAGKGLWVKGIFAVVAAVAIGLAVPTFLKEPVEPLTTSDPSTTPEPSPTEIRFQIGTVVHTTLAEAIRAAESGDVIDIFATGPIAVPPVSVTGKALTLRASYGNAPEFLVPDTEVPFFKTDSDLSLLGLLFRQDVVGAHVPLLEVEGRKLKIINCSFVRGATESGPAMITAEQSQEILFLNSSIFAPGSIGIGLRRPGGAITVENSIIWARRGMRTIFAASRNPSKITITRSLLQTGEISFDYLGLTGSVTASQTTSGNTFIAEGDFLAISEFDVSSDANLTWTSEMDRWGVAGAWMRSDDAKGVQLSGPIDWSLYFGGEAAAFRQIEPTLFSWLADFRATPWTLEPTRFRPEGFPVGAAPSSARRPGIFFEWVGPGEAYRRWSEAQ